MNLSWDYTRLRPSRRLALLTEDVVIKLMKRYGGDFVNFTDFHRRVLKDLTDINEKLAILLPGKEDLVTEWILKNTRSIAYVGGVDLNHVVSRAKFFFEHNREPRFRKIFQEWETDRRENYEAVGMNFTPMSVKNLLSFTLSGVEKIMEEYTLPEARPGVNRLPRVLPEGSELFYNNGTYQIVAVTSSGAACQLGLGTSWCTRFEETSKKYLEDNPLFILYNKGKRFGQFYYDDQENEIEVKDLDNEDIDLPEELYDVFAKHGFMSRDTDEEEEENEYNEVEEEEGWYDEDDDYEPQEDDDEAMRLYEEEQNRENQERMRQYAEHRREMEEQQRRQQQTG